MNSGIFRGWYLLVFAVCLVAPGLVRGDDVPARPAQYFNDYANAVDAGTAQALNNELVDFERQTSNQIVVVVYPKLQTEDSLDDFCYRTYQAWQVGQKGSSNGAVLFVFVQDHKMRIQTGYGLEGALPDVTCVRILDDEMAPRFKSGDYAGGLKAGIDAMIAATKGEYKGTGETVADKDAQDENNTFGIIFAVCFLILWVFLLVRKTRGILYGASGRSGFRGGFFTGSGGGGGDGFSGGGGGFSGGGGSSGGGGASGSW